jgi:hypothetical protein
MSTGRRGREHAPGSPGGWRTAVRTIEAAAFAGIGFAVLYAPAVLLLGRQPDLTSNDEELRRWFDGAEADGVLVGLYLVPFSSILFLWFLAVVRRRIGDREDRFVATVFYASGILFVALTMAASTALAAGSVAVQRLGAPAADTAALGLFIGLGQSLLLVDAVRMAAVFLISTSTLGLRTTALPTWLCAVGYLAALVLLVNPTLIEALALVVPVWVALASATLLVRRAEVDAP